MNSHKLIEPPRLWPVKRNQHRHVSWMELFFDLIFVAAVAQIGEPLAHDYSPAGVIRFSFLFVLIWWAWVGHTFYATRFDSDDLVQRILILVQCFVAAVMAANAKEGLDSRSAAGFGAAYAGMRIILVVQYLRARSVPETCELSTRYAAGFGSAAILWMASAFLAAPDRYWVWAAALLLDFATPWLADRCHQETPPDAQHFPERFGLFTIILLGEFVIKVMRGIESQEDWSLPAATSAFTSMAFAFVLRWWYFDVAKSAEERPIRNRREVVLFHVWTYTHLPLLLGIGVTGIGLEHIIALQPGEQLHLSEIWILCGAVAVTAVCLTTIGLTSSAGTQRAEPWHLAIRYAAATTPLVFAGVVWPPVLLLVALFAAVLAQTMLARRNILNRAILSPPPVRVPVRG